MRAVLVVNPKATTTTGRVQEVISEALAHRLDVTVAHTTHRGHAQEISEQARRDGVDLVVALGGDGTVNEVANGLLADGPGADVPRLGIVPGGSTNVSARSLGLPEDPVEATGALLEALSASRVRRIGLGSADGRWFVFSAGVGYDAAVVAAVEADRSRGRTGHNARYVTRAVQTFFRDLDRRSPALTVTAPAGEFTGLHLVIVQNTSPWTFLGGRPVTACPEASYETALDLAGLRELGTLRTLRTVGGVLSQGRLGLGSHAVQLHDQAWLDIAADRPMPFHLDGDYLGETTRLRLSWTAEALPVVV